MNEPGLGLCVKVLELNYRLLGPGAKTASSLDLCNEYNTGDVNINIAGVMLMPLCEHTAGSGFHTLESGAMEDLGSHWGASGSETRTTLSPCLWAHATMPRLLHGSWKLKLRSPGPCSMHFAN